MQIYIHRDDQQFGPYSIEQTQAYLATGNLLPDDLAWHEGAADWAPLSQIVGLTPPTSAPSPTLATPEEPTSRAWIPARRTDAPSSLASAPASTPAPVASSNPARRATQSVPTDPDFEPPGKSRSSRRSSSSRSNPFVQQKRAAALRNMGVGGFIALVGTVVTVFTYESATTDPHGGHYVIAWGAILFGGIRFLTGFIQFIEAK